MKAKPVRNKTNEKTIAYDFLQKQRKQMGEKAFRLMIREVMIDANLNQALQFARTNDERTAMIAKAMEMKKEARDSLGVNDDV